MDYLLKIKTIQNPNKLPLNELNLEYKNFKKTRKVDKTADLEEAVGDLKRNYDVRVEKVPALDERWIEVNHPFYFFQPYFPEVSEADNELFFSKNKQFLEGVEFLLRCSYHQFWCYITCDPVVGKVIRSFIYNALPWYEVKHLSEEGFELYSKIHDKMLLLLGKLFTYRQSEVEYMHESTILKLLEKSNLLSFTIIARLCLLYKNTDQYFIKKLVNIYYRKNKDAYNVDCKRFIEQAVTVFEMIGGHIFGFDQTAVIVPLSIGPKPKQFDPYWYADAMLLLADAVSNLNAFLGVASDQIETALELDLPKSLTFFYNRVFPRLYKTLNSQRGVAFDWSKLKDRILDNMAVARSEFINCFDIFVEKFIHDAIHAQGHQKQDEHLENYILLISSAMDEEYFIADYHHVKNIDVQLQYICDFYPGHDKMRTNYLIQCLSTLPKLQPLQNIEAVVDNSVPSASYTTEPTKHKTKSPEKPAEVEIEGKIQLIQDTLPDHGDGFILKCLEAYNYDTEAVISAILDSNLPPHIQSEPIGLIRIPPEPEPEQPILAYKGKKPRQKDTKDLLNDKSDLKEVKDFILKTSNAYDMYDDDYDDRYDYEAPTRPTEDKDDPYKYMENRFEGYDLVSDPSESSSDEQPSQVVKEKSKNFCEDPALIRQQREKKFANKDVVGKPKGQGQDKTVLKNRNKKEVNKSTRANHNRKGGAQWKRNKGMMPS